MLALDERAVLWLNQHLGSGPWLAVMAVLTTVGSGWLAFAILPLFASPRTRRFAISLSATLIVNTIAVFTLKWIVQRKRPYLVVSGVHPLVFEAPTDFSFPSGHSAGSFCTAMFIAVVLIGHVYCGSRARKRRIAASVFVLVAALGIGMSRCALGVHFPTDVLAGALLGGTLGFLGARWHQRRISVT